MRYLHHTGYHYINVLDHTNLVFQEIFYSYRDAVTPWSSVISLDQFINAVKSNDEIVNDKTVCFIVWHDIHGLFSDHDRPVGPLILRYCEIVGDHLWPAQQDMLSNLLGAPKHIYNGVLTHSRFASEYLKTHGFSSVGITPIGYNFKTMGLPNYAIKKELDLVFYGSNAIESNGRSRRSEILGQLQSGLKCKLTNISGIYWPQRNNILNISKGIMILHQVAAPHSFPTMRLWHGISSSAVMFIEPADTWPAVAGKHYIQLPLIDDTNIGLVCDIIDQNLGNSEISKAAHFELSKHTYKYCLEEFAIPAITKMLV